MLVSVNIYNYSYFFFAYRIMKARLEEERFESKMLQFLGPSLNLFNIKLTPFVSQEIG